MYVEFDFNNMQLSFLCYVCTVNPVQYILRHSDAKLIVICNTCWANDFCQPQLWSNWLRERPRRAKQTKAAQAGWGEDNEEKQLEGWGKQKRRISSENNLKRWRNEEKPKRFEPSMWSCRGTLLRMTEAPPSSNICSGSKVLSASYDNNQSWTGWWTWTATSGSLPARFFC